MLLSHIDIERALRSGRIVCEPYDPAMLQVASLEVTVGSQWLRPTPGQGPVRIATRDMRYESFTTDWLTLSPGGFVLGTTREMVGLGTGVAARFEGKSSLGRLGLITHVTAGFIDPGFRGRITLEIVNTSGVDLVIEAGDTIGQLAFTQVKTRARWGYGHQRWGSHYQGQAGVVGARA